MWHTEPEIVVAWGAFGTIFTAIAVAHTLYAPREVVLWNWRRIVLLGISLAIAIGSQFSLIVLVPMALGFLLYVAPVRRRAGTVIWIASCVVGLVLLMAFYFFNTHAFAESMRGAMFWGATWRGFTVPGVYKQVAVQMGRACPALALAFPVAAVTYARVAANSIFWEHRATVGRCFIRRVGNRASARRRRRISSRRYSVLADFCLGCSRGPAGNQLSPSRRRLHRSAASHLRCTNTFCTGAGPPWVKPRHAGRRLRLD